eukprot:TRINITY_DN520_c0_g2_i1.p1 TRINITY_DN520_c0_g2~~TRINITY_DN520_c0_g2_i1.p1  ORF type:complete len:199 (+),score=86.87 TRINITY_DN520_c0_g2_i1:1-597(+)
MSLLLLDQRHQQDLQLLTSIPLEIITQFCRIAIESLGKGTKPSFVKAAQNLGVSQDKIAAAVNALSYLFGQSARLMLNDISFIESIYILRFSPELSEHLKQLYLASKNQIREILKDTSITFPEYNNLEWRLDTQIASRCLRNQVTPIFTLKLDIKKPELESIYLQTDIVNMRHLCFELEQALDELKSAHCRRILRNIK